MPSCSVKWSHGYESWEPSEERRPFKFDSVAREFGSTIFNQRDLDRERLQTLNQGMARSLSLFKSNRSLENRVLGAF
jgi:hypothetical protein